MSLPTNYDVLKLSHQSADIQLKTVEKQLNKYVSYIARVVSLSLSNDINIKAVSCAEAE